MNIRPHDLLWLHADTTLLDIQESWVALQWNAQQPVVVRRDVMQQDRIPIGVRGSARHQRAAGWVRGQDVLRIDTPEVLLARASDSVFRALPTVEAVMQLYQQRWSWSWGVTGSTGFALATGLPVLHATSDLDLLIRAPLPLQTGRLRPGSNNCQVCPVGPIPRWKRRWVPSRLMSGCARGACC